MEDPFQTWPSQVEVLKFEPSDRLHAAHRAQGNSLQHHPPALAFANVSSTHRRTADGHFTDVHVLTDDHRTLEGIRLVWRILLERLDEFGCHPQGKQPAKM